MCKVIYYSKKLGFVYITAQTIEACVKRAKAYFKAKHTRKYRQVDEGYVKTIESLRSVK